MKNSTIRLHVQEGYGYVPPPLDATWRRWESTVAVD